MIHSRFKYILSITLNNERELIYPPNKTWNIHILMRWKKLWGGSLTRSDRKTSGGGSTISCWNGTIASQPGEITSKETRVPCVYYQNKCPYENCLEAYWMHIISIHYKHREASTIIFLFSTSGPNFQHCSPLCFAYIKQTILKLKCPGDRSQRIRRSLMIGRFLWIDLYYWKDIENNPRTFAIHPRHAYCSVRPLQIQDRATWQH